MFTAEKTAEHKAFKKESKKGSIPAAASEGSPSREKLANKRERRAKKKSAEEEEKLHKKKLSNKH